MNDCSSFLNVSRSFTIYSFTPSIEKDNKELSPYLSIKSLINDFHAVKLR